MTWRSICAFHARPIKYGSVLITTQTQNALGFVSGVVRGMEQGPARAGAALQALDEYMLANPRMFYDDQGQLTQQAGLDPADPR